MTNIEGLQTPVEDLEAFGQRIAETVKAERCGAFSGQVVEATVSIAATPPTDETTKG